MRKTALACILVASFFASSVAPSAEVLDGEAAESYVECVEMEAQLDDADSAFEADSTVADVESAVEVAEEAGDEESEDVELLPELPENDAKIDEFTGDACDVAEEPQEQDGCDPEETGDDAERPELFATPLCAEPDMALAGANSAKDTSENEINKFYIELPRLSRR